MSEIARLRRWQEHGGLLRDAVESIARGTSNAVTIRGQCRLLVKAFDEGVE